MAAPVDKPPAGESAGDPAPAGAPRKWDPAGRDSGRKLDPARFSSMTPEEKIDTLVGMIGLTKQMGGDPKAMLAEVLRTLPEDQRRALAADPVARQQLQALLRLM